jgi:hypothetical protein
VQLRVLADVVRIRQKQHQAASKGAVGAVLWRPVAGLRAPHFTAHLRPLFVPFSWNCPDTREFFAASLRVIVVLVGAIGLGHARLWHIILMVMHCVPSKEASRRA